jgi:hypothetical protein
MNAEQLIGRAAREALIAMQTAADARDRLTAVNKLLVDNAGIIQPGTSAARVVDQLAMGVRGAAVDIQTAVVRVPHTAWALFAEQSGRIVGAHEVARVAVPS